MIRAYAIRELYEPLGDAKCTDTGAIFDIMAHTVVQHGLEEATAASLRLRGGTQDIRPLRVSAAPGDGTHLLEDRHLSELRHGWTASPGHLGRRAWTAPK